MRHNKKLGWQVFGSTHTLKPLRRTKKKMLKMQGEDSKILGTIGDYEIGAKWQWKLNTSTISTYLLASSLLIFLFMTVGFTFLGIQFSRLSQKQAELTEIGLDIIKIQSEVQMELKELKKLKEELSVAYSNKNGSSDDGDIIYREKRSDSSRSFNNQRSKTSTKKIKKDLNSTIDKSSSKHSNTKHALMVTAVHLERNVDFTTTGSNGIINRWHPQYWSPTNNSLVVESLKLEDHNSSLVIPSTGLYLIYAQLCYAATKDNNSYEVRVINQGATSSQSKIIAQCSAGTTILDNDITCYTSVVQMLQANDKVYLQQIQKNRHLLMSMGRSFLGIVKLN